MAAEDLNAQLHRVGDHDHPLQSPPVARDRGGERFEEGPVLCGELAAGPGLFGNRDAGGHYYDVSRDLVRSSGHLDVRGRLIESIEQIHALREERSLGALGTMSYQLQRVGGGHERSTQEMNGERLAYLASRPEDRNVHRSGLRGAGKGSWSDRN